VTANNAATLGPEGIPLTIGWLLPYHKIIIS
jgi:hypothetical protein